MPRDFNISQDHLEKFGYSEDCGRCRVLKRGGKPTMHHTKNCRDRIRQSIEASGKDEVLKRANSRQDEYVAAQVKAAVENSGSVFSGGIGDPGGSDRGGVPLKENADISRSQEGEEWERAAASAPVPDDSDLEEDAGTKDKNLRRRTADEDPGERMNRPSKRTKLESEIPDKENAKRKEGKTARRKTRKSAGKKKKKRGLTISSKTSCT